jgi:hypothetical protein
VNFFSFCSSNVKGSVAYRVVTREIGFADNQAIKVFRYKTEALPHTWHYIQKVKMSSSIYLFRSCGVLITMIYMHGQEREISESIANGRVLTVAGQIPASVH